MRIKSYFAPSVQAAIAMARREFGDTVTLVTSHVASADSRHLGEYEVVFAVEESTTVPDPVLTAVDPVSSETTLLGQVGPAAVHAAASLESPALTGVPPPQFTAFQQLLLGAVAKKPPADDLSNQLDKVRSALIELGIECEMVKVLMTLIERSLHSTTQPENSIDMEQLSRQVPESEPPLERPRRNILATVIKHSGSEHEAEGNRARTRAARSVNASSTSGLSSAEEAFLLSVTAQPSGRRS